MALQVATATFAANDSVAITYADVGSDAFGYAVGNIDNVDIWIENPTRTGCDVKSSGNITGDVSVAVYPK